MDFLKPNLHSDYKIKCLDGYVYASRFYLHAVRLNIPTVVDETKDVVATLLSLCACENSTICWAELGDNEVRVLRLAKQLGLHGLIKRIAEKAVPRRELDIKTWLELGVTDLNALIGATEDEYRALPPELFVDSEQAIEHFWKYVIAMNNANIDISPTLFYQVAGHGFDRDKAYHFQKAVRVSRLPLEIKKELFFEAEKQARASQSTLANIDPEDIDPKHIDSEDIDSEVCPDFDLDLTDQSG